MKKNYINRYHELEKRHWWFIARRQLIKELLEKHLKKGSKVLDAGCGTGVNICEFSKYDCIGLDQNKEFISICKKNGLNAVEGNFLDSPFNEETFDGILCLDMLEHLEDDLGGIKEIYRLLKKRGSAIITVPAFMLLWSVHDETNEHKRRYTKKGLEKKFIRQGFKIVRSTYWNCIMFLPVLIIKKLNKIIGRKDDFSHHTSLVNSVFLKVLGLEKYLIMQDINLPIGASIVIIVQK